MSPQFVDLLRSRCLALAALGACSGAYAIRPSDCLPGNADSTCARAVVGVPLPAPPPPTSIPGSLLYDGPLGGVPASGYAYWGFDFASDLAGIPSPYVNDMFVNRSAVPVNIALTFDFPTNHPCRNDCLPGVQFQVKLGWFAVDPKLKIKGNTVSASMEIEPGEAYAWVIGLWQSTNPRLTVTVPDGVSVTLADVGLPADPSIALEVPATLTTCDCWDGTTRQCSAGNRFTDGLMGYWFQNNEQYVRAGAFNNCPAER